MKLRPIHISMMLTALGACGFLPFFGVFPDQDVSSYRWVIYVMSSMAVLIGYLVFIMSPFWRNPYDQEPQALRSDIELLQKNGYRIWMPVPKSKLNHDNLENAMDRLRIRGMIMTKNDLSPIDTFIEVCPQNKDEIKKNLNIIEDQFRGH